MRDEKRPGKNQDSSGKVKEEEEWRKTGPRGGDDDHESVKRGAREDLQASKS